VTVFLVNGFDGIDRKPLAALRVEYTGFPVDTDHQWY